MALSDSSARAVDEMLLAAASIPASADRPEAAQLTWALLQAEKSAKRGRWQLDPAELEGTWRLRFTAPNKPRLKNGEPTSRGFYIPSLVQAEIGFQSQVGPPPLTIHNQLTAGPLRIRFNGNAKFIAKKNLLAFGFTQLRVGLARLPLYRGSVSQPSLQPTDSVGRAPFFAFFAAAEDYIAARGRGGGLALWVKLPTPR